MSNLKAAIKTITTEGTKKRYWPSKNPIDDPSDFPGEQNFCEEEAEVTDPAVQHNMFQVKVVRAAIQKRIHEIDREAGWTPEAEWLDWLHTVMGSYDQDSHGKDSITRPEFIKLLQHWRINTKTRHPSDGWGELNIQKVLDDSIGKAGGKELYADNIGAYGGKLEGEEEDEYGRDQGATDDDGPEYDDDKVYQTQQCASCGGDGCDLCDYSGDFGQWVSRGEENEESDNPFAGLADDFDERFAMKREKEHKRTQKPGAPENGDNHFAGLADDFDERFGGSENEEQQDCQRCGNTGYAMDNGQPCPNCDEGKAEKHAQLASETENEEVVAPMPTTKYAKTLKDWMKT